VTTTEQIDRIERDVENIHANLDKGDRLMRYLRTSLSRGPVPHPDLPPRLAHRGIESFGGYLKNKFSSATQIRGTGTAIERKVLLPTLRRRRLLP